MNLKQYPNLGISAAVENVFRKGRKQNYFNTCDDGSCYENTHESQTFGLNYVHSYLHQEFRKSFQFKCASVVDILYSTGFQNLPCCKWIISIVGILQ